MRQLGSARTVAVLLLWASACGVAPADTPGMSLGPASGLAQRNGEHGARAEARHAIDESEPRIADCASRVDRFAALDGHANQPADRILQ
jgi:hypothetical protein